MFDNWCYSTVQDAFYKKDKNGFISFNCSDTDLNILAYFGGGECVDCIEGCLLDNVIYACKDGYLALYEYALNSNSSGYKVEYQPYKKGNNDVLDKWVEFGLEYNKDLEEV